MKNKGSVIVNLAVAFLVLSIMASVGTIIYVNYPEKKVTENESIDITDETTIDTTPDQDETTPIKETKVVSTNNNKTYSHSRGLFKLSYPTDWSLVEHDVVDMDTVSIVSLNKADPSGKEEIARISILLADKNMDDLLRASVKQTNEGAVSIEDTFNINGIKTIYTEYNLGPENIFLQYSYHVPYNNSVFILQLAASAYKPAVINKEEIKKIASSIEISKNEATWTKYFEEVAIKSLESLDQARALALRGQIQTKLSYVKVLVDKYHEKFGHYDNLCSSNEFGLNEEITSIKKLIGNDKFWCLSNNTDYAMTALVSGQYYCSDRLNIVDPITNFSNKVTCK